MTCWDGSSPSSFEQKLVAPLPTYALEQLRLRFMYALTSPFDAVKSARVAMQMAFETEIRAVLVKMITLPASVPETVVCERVHYVNVDATLQSYRFMVDPAFDELAALPTMPGPYVDFLRRYTGADYPRYRVCAIAAMLCVATFLQSS